MRKILQRNEKVELNSFIDEFVKARQKYFTPGQEWLEAELAEEKISVYMDKAQLEKDLDELVKTSLMYGKVRNLEMKIQVKKTADGAGICFSDNGVGNWRNKSICVTGKPGRGLKKVFCKTSQYGNQIAEDYENTGFLRSVFIVCSIKKRQPGNSRAAVNFSNML